MNSDELAKSLGMSKATLYKRSRELGISKSSLDSLTPVQKENLRNFSQHKNKLQKINENLFEFITYSDEPEQKITPPKSHSKSDTTQYLEKYWSELEKNTILEITITKIRNTNTLKR